MDNELKSRLYDILIAIHEIDSFFEDEEIDFKTYQGDIKTKRALERNFEIIGEAMNRILRNNENINITNARKFVDVRNRIIHGYDTVSDKVIWGILINHLPALNIEIEKLLEE